MKWAYYNDVDEKKCAWLKELIKQGAITDGEVDSRPIQLVQPDDIRGFQRVHMFAGIGVWDFALNLAGWGDRPVWTGSCPCPPFSAASKKKFCPECSGGVLVCCPRRTGYFICATCRHAWLADDRHLYPEWWRLIVRRRPPVVFGEQVASDDGLAWLSIVRASLEIAAYAAGAVDLPASSVGSPNIRQRLWFVAESDEGRRGWRTPDVGRFLGDGTASRWLEDAGDAGWRSATGLLGDANGAGPQGRGIGGDGANELLTGTPSVAGAPGPVNGFWGDADWIYCRDEKWRPVEPAPVGLADEIASDLGCVRVGGHEIVHPLQKASPARTLRLRGYGDAINAEAAAAFIRSYLEGGLR